METRQRFIENVLLPLLEGVGISPDHLSDTTDFTKDLGFDSLDLAQMMVSAEQEFDIIIKEEDAGSQWTVGDAVTYIEGKLEMEARLREKGVSNGD